MFLDAQSTKSCSPTISKTLKPLPLLAGASTGQFAQLLLYLSWSMDGYLHWTLCTHLLPRRCNPVGSILACNPVV